MRADIAPRFEGRGASLSAMSKTLSAFRSLLGREERVSIIDLTVESDLFEDGTPVYVSEVRPLRRAWLCSWANRHSKHVRWWYNRGELYRLCERCAASIPLPAALERVTPAPEAAQAYVTTPPTGVVKPTTLTIAPTSPVPELVGES